MSAMLVGKDLHHLTNSNILLFGCSRIKNSPQNHEITQSESLIFIKSLVGGKVYNVPQRAEDEW